MSENTLNQSNKKHLSRKLIIIILIAFLLAVGIYFILTNYFSTNKNLPKPNTLYTGFYKDEPILFFRNMEMGMSYNEDVGRYISYKNANHSKRHSENYIHFYNVQEPKALFKYERFATIENFLLSDDKEYIVISFTGGKNDDTNYIYQSNLKTGKSKKVFEHKFMKGEAPYNGGAPHLTSFIPDRYVVFEFVMGDPPPASAPAGAVIKNIQTGDEKVLGVVGDVNINLKDKKVTFKNLEQRVLLCQKVDGKKDPDCFPTDTYKTGFTPEGDTLTQPLP